MAGLWLSLGVYAAFTAAMFGWAYLKSAVSFQ